MLRLETLRAILAVAEARDPQILQLDVNTVFFCKVICSKIFIWTNQKVLLCLVINQKSAEYKTVFTVKSKHHGIGMKNLIQF